MPEPDSVQAWLTTVMQNLAIDKLRRENWMQRWLRDAEGLAPEAPSAEVDAAQAEEANHALRLLADRLNPTGRRRGAASRSLRTELQQIAEATGKTEASCRQQLHRALMRLRSGEATVIGHARDEAETRRRFTSIADRCRIATRRYCSPCCASPGRALSCVQQQRATTAPNIVLPGHSRWRAAWPLADAGQPVCLRAAVGHAECARGIGRPDNRRNGRRQNPAMNKSLWGMTGALFGGLWIAVFLPHSAHCALVREAKKEDLLLTSGLFMGVGPEEDGRDPSTTRSSNPMVAPSDSPSTHANNRSPEWRGAPQFPYCTMIPGSLS